MASPKAEILGITCTAGNVSARQVARNNLAWLDLCDYQEVEVALGAEVPVVHKMPGTIGIHGPKGVGYADLPVSNRKLSRRHAVELWIENAKMRPGQITGLVTGPLTNLALAIKLEPDLPNLLKRVVIMGGTFNHPGNTNPTTEWNIAADPEAAKIVFDAFSDLPGEPRLIMCPLDITEKIQMTPRHVAALATASGCALPEELSAGDPVGKRSTASRKVIRFFSDAVRFYMEFHENRGQGYLCYMHDPFAAAIAVEPGLGTLTPAVVDVELCGALTRGQTVADWRGMWGRRANTQVVTHADPEVFFHRITSEVGALASRVGD